MIKSSDKVKTIIILIYMKNLRDAQVFLFTGPSIWCGIFIKTAFYEDLFYRSLQETAIPMMR